jgi:hypothetical protein
LVFYCSTNDYTTIKEIKNSPWEKRCIYIATAWQSDKYLLPSYYISGRMVAVHFFIGRRDMSRLPFYDTTELSSCRDIEAVDKALEGITENQSDYRLKVKLIYDHLGIKQSFTSASDVADISMEDEYIHARHHLVCLNTDED